MDRLKDLHPPDYVKDRLEKATGEGSRGGKVIGHRSDGTPIYYDSKVHDPSYAHYTPTDERRVMESKPAFAHPTLDKLKQHYNVKEEGDELHLQHKTGQDFPYRIKQTARGTHQLDQQWQDRNYTKPQWKKVHEASPELLYDTIAKRHNKAAKYMGPSWGTIEKADVTLDDYAGTHIEKSFVQPELVKGGGEGSRGGDVIGHTASGKPVYAKKAGRSFSTQDHLDAARLHKERADHHRNESKNLTSKQRSYIHRRSKGHHDREAEYHDLQADRHQQDAVKEQNRLPGKDA